MKIAVTGGTGFIGSHFVPALVGSGHEVTVIVEPGWAGSLSGVTIRAVDIAGGDGLADAFAGADAVIHAAARNHVLREKTKDPLAEYRKVNVEGTRKVVREATSSGARIFIHLSSVKAMGEGSGEGVTEKDACHPETPYGISKLESEEIVRVGSVKGGMRAAILRLPMVYGPGNKGNIPRMVRWANRGLPFPLFQPDNLRSMIYVGNVVAGVIAVLKSLPATNAAHTTYLVRDGEDYSTRMLYSAICRVLGKTPRFLLLPAVLVRYGGMISEDFRKITSSFRVSSDKIARETGYIPPFTLMEGIAETVRWFRRSDR